MHQIMKMCRKLQSRIDRTIAFKLAEPNVAFLEYMTMAILPKHLLDGEDMQESDFFRHPIGTGPYKLESLGCRTVNCHGEK